ncbi:hypothetical protein Aph01nite_00820 [Acrocarpospora phusangensis]|uniref:Uncharacterized protein n=1 Tax=Acrocarpospora phusangensis TaxID=1070424 RepID=A0A919Q3R7_9ACTN|nr:hypothetical protein [Acrocarpospora phusangensis]GIH21772.1 hypothetical protein Aph01nite_00820 [Acrocarpospora phusangensis]
MPDYVYGTSVGRDSYVQHGSGSIITVNNSGEGASRAEIDAAVAELRAFITTLTRTGAVTPDGTVTDPAAVVAAVESEPGRLRALGTAIAGGAKEAILTAVQTGVATLIVALVGKL